MLPQKQTEFGPTGNCLAACIATLLEVPLATVPNFILSPMWWSDLNRWLWTRQYVLKDADSFSSQPVLAIGRSPRERNRGHAVIYQYGRLVFDPHPDNTGIQVVESAYLVIPYIR